MQRGFISFLAKVLLDKSKNCGNIHHADAAIAHLVERHLAKVEVASSSLVGRSTKPIAYAVGFFLYISAGMVELADTLDLGSSGKPCRIKSCCPHQKRGIRKDVPFLVASLRLAKIRFAQLWREGITNPRFL